MSPNKDSGLKQLQNYIFKVKIREVTHKSEPLRPQGCKTITAAETRCLRPVITTQVPLVMSYKMSLPIYHQLSSVLRFFFLKHIHRTLYISFSHPRLAASFFQPVISSSHSSYRQHFPFFHPLSICFLNSSHLSSTSLSLSHSLRLLDISLSLFCVPLHSQFPLFPLWWMSLSTGCSSYLLSRGAHTVSLSCPPHLYPSTKETERARGYCGIRGGGRPQSPRFSAGSDGKKVETSLVRLSWLKEREKSSAPLHQPVNAMILIVE